MERNEWYRKIPKVNDLLGSGEIGTWIGSYGRDQVTEAIREELSDLRKEIGTLAEKDTGKIELEERLQSIPQAVKARLDRNSRPSMGGVINGTGTILHTNLGRAPLSQRQMAHVAAVAAGYSNLEYDLKEGTRGDRYAHFEKRLCRLTGAEAAMAVNNNAAAMLLVLNTLAKGGQVVTSRGELVEIGGKFRIPDVMEQSGACLKEVGTTNKTHREDYERAICEETRCILKVHTSNYRIVGFTESVSREELIRLAHGHDLPFVEDLGSGVLVGLEKYGLPHEPTVQEAVEAGADVVCFSGDKLLGGPQAGIILGKKKYLDQIKKNPLTRALRMDKLTAAALEAVLMEYASEEKAIREIPVLEMITRSQEQIRAEAEEVRSFLTNGGIRAECTVESCRSQMGGGALPTAELDSFCLRVCPREISVTELHRRLRQLAVPVIGRMEDDGLLLDFRTVQEGQKEILKEQLSKPALWKEKKDG